MGEVNKMASDDYDDMSTDDEEYIPPTNRNSHENEHN